MDNIVSRFLTFEETLGRGLVKFAYFVILIGLVVWAVVEVVGGIILLFDRPLAGLWEIVHTPFEFALWAMLLRVATELILAVLSIDDNLAETALADRGRSGAGRDADVPRVAVSPTPTSPPAPRAAKADPSAAEASASSPSPASSGSSSSPSSAGGSGGRTSAKRAPAKTAKKAAKKTAKSTASTQATVKAASASPASARSDAGKSGGEGGDGGGKAS